MLAFAAESRPLACDSTQVCAPTGWRRRWFIQQPRYRAPLDRCALINCSRTWRPRCRAVRSRSRFAPARWA
jgi:hypothetical protein